MTAGDVSILFCIVNTIALLFFVWQGWRIFLDRRKFKRMNDEFDAILKDFRNNGR